MIETLRDFVAKANDLGIDFMVTGSFAMSAYGEIRFTRDIDVVIQITADDITQFVQTFESDYYISHESVRRAVASGSMFNLVSYAHGGKVDCIVMKDTEFARVSFDRRWKASVSGVEFWATTREDLVIAKLNWTRDTHSEMQIRDIANLTSSEYDADYVAGWIESLKLQEIWSEVEKWTTQRENAED